MDSIVPRNRDQIISLFEYKFMSCSTLGKKKSLDFPSILFTTALCYVMHFICSLFHTLHPKISSHVLHNVLYTFL